MVIPYTHWVYVRNLGTISGETRRKYDSTCLGVSMLYSLAAIRLLLGFDEETPRFQKGAEGVSQSRWPYNPTDEDRAATD
jgi:hypothetical protein